MARKRNAVSSTKVTLTVAPVIREYLEALIPFGFYGKNPAEVATKLVNDKLEELLIAGDRRGAVLTEIFQKYNAPPTTSAQVAPRRAAT